MDLNAIAKLLAGLGLALLVAAGLFWMLGRLGIVPGRLPGDIRLQGSGFTCVIGLGTSLLLSVILTLLLNQFIRLRR